MPSRHKHEPAQLKACRQHSPASPLRSLPTFINLFQRSPGVQIASDVVLQPLGRFAEEPLAAAYPATPAGHQVAGGLAMINLRAD